MIKTEKIGPRLVQLIGILTIVSLISACSLKTYAVNMVGDALASGNSVYETDDDLELVGEALPFGLKLTETLLTESPSHEGLLLTACRGFVLYSNVYVDYPSQVAMDEDFSLAQKLRGRARKLYRRGLDYCLRGLEKSHAGFKQKLLLDPEIAVMMIRQDDKERDLPFMYWSAASLGLSISLSLDSAAMIARLPEVEALLDRAMELDESWDDGALHAFKVQFAGAMPGELDDETIQQHYDQALKLSEGKSAGLHVAFAEAVSVPNQNAAEFREMIAKALAVDPAEDPDNRLLNQIAHRRATWLLDRIDDLILPSDP